MSNIDPYIASNALAAGYGQAASMAQNRARRDAGNALAGGDRQAAMAALGGAGDLASQRVIGQDMQAEEQRGIEAQEAERKEKLTFVLNGATSLLQVPPAERRQVYQQTFRPVLEQMGFPPEVLLQLDQSDMSDGTLNGLVAAVGGEVRKPTAFNTRQGIVEQQPYGGYELAYPIEAEAPSAPAGFRYTTDGNMEYIPGGPADPRVRGVQAAATRAPRRTGNSGVNGSARPGSQGQAAPAAGLPTGFTIRGR